MNEIEITPPTVIREAIADFANALVATSQFMAFEQADDRLRKDIPAQQALSAYQMKWKSLEALIRLNALSRDDQQELELLRQKYATEPSVVAYVQAQAELVALCQDAGNKISLATGLNFSAVCRSGCCG